MRLYDIAKDLETLIEGSIIVDDETGEILLDADNLDETEIKFDEKLEGVGLYIKNLNADIEAFSNEIKRLQHRKKIAENKVKRLKEYALYCMKLADRNRLETSKVAISQRKSSFVDITSEDIVPSRFVNVEEVKHIDKNAIREALKGGEVVAGAEMGERLSLILK